MTGKCERCPAARVRIYLASKGKKICIKCVIATAPKRRLSESLKGKKKK